MTFFLFASVNGEKISIHLYFCKRNCPRFLFGVDGKPQSAGNWFRFIDSTEKQKNSTKLFFHRSSSQSPKIPLEVLLKFLSQQIFRSISFPFHASVSVPKCFNKENNWCKMKVSELIVFRDRLLSNCVWLHPLTRPVFCRVSIQTEAVELIRKTCEWIYIFFVSVASVDSWRGSLCKNW